MVRAFDHPQAGIHNTKIPSPTADPLLLDHLSYLLTYILLILAWVLFELLVHVIIIQKTTHLAVFSTEFVPAEVKIIGRNAVSERYEVPFPRTRLHAVAQIVNLCKRPDHYES
jgi:hypothetical protein